MVANMTVRYRTEDRRAFANGRLCREWALNYPHLFDHSDLARALVQGVKGRHFHEWLTAISLHQATGFNCVLAKYQFRRRHPAKFAIFEQLVPARVRALLPQGGRPQGPDLLMYSPSMDDWFFAEAKGICEVFTTSQEALFPLLERESEKAICVVRLWKVDENVNEDGPAGGLTPSSRRADQ